MDDSKELYYSIHYHEFYGKFKLLLRIILNIVKPLLHWMHFILYFIRTIILIFSILSILTVESFEV